MRLIQGDCVEVLKSLQAESVRCCVTSPPYFGLRDYGVDGQIGLEKTPDEYVARLVEVFREVRRVLADDGTLWLNLGDSYAATSKGSGGTARSAVGNGKGQSTNAGCFFAIRHFDLNASGIKPKDLIGIPWRVAFALQADGWYLRQDIIWHKPNPMPESVRDRCTKAHEYLFLLAKNERYFFDSDALRELAACSPKARNVVVDEGARKALRTDTEKRHRSAIAGGQTLQASPDGFRNRRSVWSVPTSPFKGAHFATFPPALVEPCVRAGSAPGDVVLDPFNGAGTTGLVAMREGRQYVGIDLNADYLALAAERLKHVVGIGDLL